MLILLPETKANCSHKMSVIQNMDADRWENKLFVLLHIQPCLLTFLFFNAYVFY